MEDVPIKSPGNDEVVINIKACATVMLFGLTSPSCEIAVRPYEIFRKELTVRASFINPYTFDRAVSLVSQKKINVKAIISAGVGFDKIIDVFRDNELRKKGKIILNNY